MSENCFTSSSSRLVEVVGWWHREKRLRLPMPKAQPALNMRAPRNQQRSPQTEGKLVWLPANRPRGRQEGTCVDTQAPWHSGWVGLHICSLVGMFDLGSSRCFLLLVIFLSFSCFDIVVFCLSVLLPTSFLQFQLLYQYYFLMFYLLLPILNSSFQVIPTFCSFSVFPIFSVLTLCPLYSVLALS